MLNRFLMLLLLFAAFTTQSFTTIAPLEAPKVVATATMSNPSPGTLVLSWDFGPVTPLSYYIIEDVVHRQVVASGQTSQASVTVNGLTSSNYKCTVSNGASFIIIEDVVH